MKKRLALVAVVALSVFAAGHWACDGTIRDPRHVDRLMRDATWHLPDASRPAIRRVHASRTRDGVGGGLAEHLYVEFTRPNDLQEFIRGVTSKLEEADVKSSGRWQWTLGEDVQIDGRPPSREAPGWWPGAGRADAVLSVHGGATLVAPAGSDRLVLWYYVPG
jgi:hypothetical protein